jgi:midasin (ATPase involved in ribosome maturation)
MSKLDPSTSALLKSKLLSAKEKRTTAIVSKQEKDQYKPKKYSRGSIVTLNGYFKVESGTYEVLKRNIVKSVNTLLIGPTGTGKTELVSNIAKELGKDITIFDMGTMSDPIMGLVGTHTISVVDGKTYSKFKKSRFSEVIQQPGIVLLDEISRASVAANNLLFPVLDFRKELSMEYSFEDTTPIKVHPECVFFATANMGSQYTGTHKLDRALIDRFMTVEVDSLSTDNIKETLKYLYPSINETVLDKIVSSYDKINQEHDEFRISFNLSLRHLKVICGLVVDGFTLYDAFFVLCKGLGGKEGIAAIKSIIEKYK